MSNVYLKRDYTVYNTIVIPVDVGTGEFELPLSANVDSSMGYLLVEPGTVKQETIFFHRAVANTVYIYQINRTNPVEHLESVNVLLANSIDYMNYIIGQIPEQLFMYYKSNKDIVIKGGKAYIASQMITLADLDTSLLEVGKTFTNSATNYIYIDTENLDFLITTEVNPNYFLVATVYVGVGGIIESLTKEKVLHIGTIGKVGPPGLQGSPGAKGDKGDPGNTGNGISSIELLSSNGLIDTYRINLTSGSSYSFNVSNGDEIELQKTNEFIQWKRIQDISWNNLVALSEIKGNPGDPGLDGLPGLDGNPGLDGDSAYQIAVANGFVGTEIQWLESLNGDISEQTQKIVSDNQDIVGVITVNEIEKIIRVDNADGSYYIITETGTEEYDVNGEFVIKLPDTCVYTNGVMVCESGTTVDGITGDVIFNDGAIAYTNKVNNFTEKNTFNSLTEFKGDVTFPWYNQNTVNTVHFDTSKGRKHIFSINNGGTKIMNFSNLVPGTNYEFFINVLGNSTILSFNGSSFVNCGNIIQVYAFGDSISSTTYNITLSGDSTHHFVCTLGASAIHLSYTGISQRVSINEASI